MKKIYTLLAACLLPAWGMMQAATIPYSSELGGDGALDSGWTVIDVNNDGKTWANDAYASTRGYDQAGAAHGVIYSYHRTNQGNDLLISPAIHLEEGKEYKVSFWVKTGGYNESLKLMMSNGNQASNFEYAVELLDLPSYKNNTAFERKTCVFTNRGEGDYYFAFKAYSLPDMAYIYMTAFKIAENVLTPGAPTGLTASVGDNDAITVDLAWTLPTVTDEGETLEASAITGVRITRDGTVVANLPAGTTSWRDTEATGLTAGVHTYEVSALAGDAIGTPAKVVTGYVGPLPVQTIPYTSDLSSQDAVGDLWTIISGPGSTQTKGWNYYSSSIASSCCFQFTATSGAEDEYLITPPLKMEKAGAYKMTFVWAAGARDPMTERLEVLLGKNRSIAGLNTVVKTFTKTEIPNSSGSRYTYEVIFDVAEPGTYYMGFHACSPEVYSIQGYGDVYRIYSVEVVEHNILPAQVTDLTATPASDGGNMVNLAWTNPAKDNTGGDLDQLTKVEVLRAPVTGTGYSRRPGEFAVVNTIDNPAPGATMTLTDEVPAPGFYAYQVVAYNAHGAAEGDPVTVMTDWVGDLTQPLPYEYNFGDESHFAAFYTVVDANADGNTFQWTSGYQARFNHNDTAADDWLVTPPFDFEPGYYKVTIGYNGKGAQFAVGTVTDASAPAASFVQKEQVTVTDYGNFTREMMIEVPETGKRCIAIHDVSGAEASYLQIKSIAVARTEVLPDVATDLTAQSEGMNVTLTWTNPTGTNIDDLALEAIAKAVVLRNGEPVAEITEGLLPGQPSTYVDEVPAVGPYAYSVEIYNDYGKSEKDAPVVSLDWVGGGLPLPFEATFAAGEWTIVNANNDSQTYTETDEWGEYSWTEDFTWNATNGHLNYGYSNRVADDWAMSPRLQFEPGTIVKVTVASSTVSGRDINWELALAGDMDHTLMNVVKTITTTGSGQVQTDELYFLVNESTTPAGMRRADIVDPVAQTQPGINVLGIHAIGAGDISIVGFKAEVCEDSPVAVNDLRSSRSVAAVRYYNVAGQCSSKPFDGMNVVVTTYDDGTIGIAKVVR